MTKLNVTSKLSRSFHKMGFALKKHSPEILLAAGVVGTVATTVIACKATTKLSDILDQSNDNAQQINNYVEENGYTEKYTEKDQNKDLRIIYAKTGVQVAKLYAPAIALGTLSITAILASHNLLHKRNVALAAAYTAVDRGFKDYRGRVVERFGKDLDNELRFNIKAKEIKEMVVNENGETEEVTKTVTVVDVNDLSDYSRLWYEGNRGWTKDPQTNLNFLKVQQSYANDKLRLNGKLYLNEVYEMLGFAATKEGHMVGWIYDEKNPVGDNFVDFGILKAPDFVNGIEGSILLDFNVDGNIYELLY